MEAAAGIVGQASNPIILAGHGVIRRRASAQLTALVEECALPLCHTFIYRSGQSPGLPRRQPRAR